MFSANLSKLEKTARTKISCSNLQQEQDYDPMIIGTEIVRSRNLDILQGGS